MAWVWDSPKEAADWGADIDYVASAPMSGTEYLEKRWLDPSINRPVFSSRTGLQKFKKLHCPPIYVAPAVDTVWRDIILQFVPEDRVQFLPIRLIARGEICDDYFWPIVMDRAFCIDPVRSDITQQRQYVGELVIYGVRRFVHCPGCLGSLHIARDARMSSHLLVSDEMKDALSATGEDSMFFRPEDVVTIDNYIEARKDRTIN